MALCSMHAALAEGWVVVFDQIMAPTVALACDEKRARLG
jgi:hypothetical protein